MFSGLEPLDYVCPNFGDATAYRQSTQTVMNASDYIETVYRDVWDIHTTNAVLRFHSKFQFYMSINNLML